MNRSIPLTTGALLLFACGPGPGAESAADADSTTAQPMEAPAPSRAARVTPEQFAALHWLEGTWRGSGVDQPTFYERYTFVDDSTIRAESSPDSTFPDPDEADTIELRAGRVTTGGAEMEWAVSSIDDGSVRFDPLRGANNAFVWTSESDSAWTARLTWTDRDGEAHERIYEMRRMP